jgi:hypothetical protein
MQKSITFTNFEQSILNVTAGNTNAFQSYNSSIYKSYKIIDPVEQAAYNNDVRYRFNDLFWIAL